MKYATTLLQAEVGERVLVTTSGISVSNRKFAQITKVTPKQLEVDGRRYWRSGDNMGNEVGQASRDWRMSIGRTRYHISCMTDAEEIGKVLEEMQRRERAKRAQDALAERKRSEKLARRAQRFEGDLDTMQKRVERLITDDGDETINAVAKRIAGQLYDFVWHIEDNESSLRTKIAREHDELQRLTTNLDNDHNPWYSQNGTEISELIAERKRLMEGAKRILYIARALVGETDES